MCFRPPISAKPIKCPQCGFLNPATAAKCKKCNADLSVDKGDNNNKDK
ncbi:hypothetical protein AusDCA_2718 [Desulfitobacterium sp. AusDCA]